MAQPPYSSPALSPPTGLPGRSGNQVPRAFQIFLALYVLLTGDLPTAIQGALFGLVGGAEAEFAIAMLTSITVDLLLIASVLLLATNRLGLLHPLLLAVVVWPVLVRMPSLSQEFAVWASLLLGEPVETPFYIGLGWRPPNEVWMAIAKFKMIAGLSLGATYAGFAFGVGRNAPIGDASDGLVPKDSRKVRRLLLVLAAVSCIAIMLFIQFRGGLADHIADFSRGRFRSLGGLGPFVAVADLGVIAVLLWMAFRPSDSKSLLFVATLIAVAAAQFLSNGSRIGALSVFMLTGIIWAVRTGRIPWRLALTLAPIVFFLLGALSIIRSSGLEQQGAVGALSDRSVTEVLSELRDELQLRAAISSAVPVVEDGYELTEGPMWGRTYLAAVLGFVPRSIWEEKPRGPGSLYTQLFLGEAREGTAVPVPPSAEVYWNFGMGGVVLVFLLYGMLIRMIHVFYSRRSGNAFALCFYILFLTTFRPGTDDLVLFQQQLLMLLVAYGAFRFFVPTGESSGARRSLSPQPA